MLLAVCCLYQISQAICRKTSGAVGRALPACGGQVLEQEVRAGSSQMGLSLHTASQLRALPKLLLQLMPLLLPPSQESLLSPANRLAVVLNNVQWAL